MQANTIIIGGGFFGLSIALYLSGKIDPKTIVVIEKENDFMQRASYNNQARVHGGYHYPRSLLTARRSQANFGRFVSDFEESIVNDFEKYYAVAHSFSKVSARQFKLFCERIGAEITIAPAKVKSLFSRQLIDDVFRVREYAFDATKLKNKLVAELARRGVRVVLSESIETVASGKQGLILESKSGKTYVALRVFNCSYSLLNKLNVASGFPLLPLKHELAEMCLIDLPETLKDLAVTVMCGPFFSFMPFPDRRLNTLSHVRYTPHSEWTDTVENYRDGHKYIDNDIKKVSHFPQMLSDAKRYIPALKNATYSDSLWEIKTVLLASEHDDSRPILFRKDHGLKGYTVVMGGKLDNIYDVYRSESTL